MKTKKSEEDLSIASFVIKEYKQDVQNLKKTNEKLSECIDEINKTNAYLLKTNKIQTILIVILVIFSILLSWYGIMYWDSTHPEHGIINQKSE